MKLQLPTPPSSRCPDEGPGSSDHQPAGTIESPGGPVRLWLVLRAGLALIVLQLACPVGAPAAADRKPANLAVAPVAVNWGAARARTPRSPARICCGPTARHQL